MLLGCELFMRPPGKGERGRSGGMSRKQKGGQARGCAWGLKMVTAGGAGGRSRGR